MRKSIHLTNPFLGRTVICSRNTHNKVINWFINIYSWRRRGGTASTVVKRVTLLPASLLPGEQHRDPFLCPAAASSSVPPDQLGGWRLLGQPSRHPRGHRPDGSLPLPGLKPVLRICFRFRYLFISALLWNSLVTNYTDCSCSFNCFKAFLYCKKVLGVFKIQLLSTNREYLLPTS